MQGGLEEAVFANGIPRRDSPSLEPKPRPTSTSLLNPKQRLTGTDKQASLPRQSHPPKRGGQRSPPRRQRRRDPDRVLTLDPLHGDKNPAAPLRLWALGASRGMRCQALSGHWTTGVAPPGASIPLMRSVSPGRVSGRDQGAPDGLSRPRQRFGLVADVCHSS